MLYARGDMASRFPMIRFDITNFTDKEIFDAPGMIQAAKLERWQSDADQIARSADETDRRSTRETMIQVGMQTDLRVNMEKAVKLLREQAARLRGEVDFDTGTIDGVGSLLEGHLGHRPEHEDFPKLIRFVLYRFT